MQNFFMKEDVSFNKVNETIEMNQIIHQVSMNWSKDHMIRYLYIKLAPYFQRDLLYFSASEEEKYEQYQKGFIPRGRFIVCSTLADFYVNLFAKFNIRAKKIQANSAKIPLFALIVEGTYGWFFIDPINDLFRNQYELSPTEFGIIPHYQTLQKNYPYLITLPIDYISQIDQDLNLPNTLDNFFHLLHLEMSNRNYICDYFQLPKNDSTQLFESKLEFADKYLINLGKVYGPHERILLYHFLERILFYKTEKKKIKLFLNNSYPIPLITIIFHDFQKNHTLIFEEQRQEHKFTLNRVL